MRVKLDMGRTSHLPYFRDIHGSFVVDYISRVYCALRALGLSRDAKYLSPRRRMWVIERDSHVQYCIFPLIGN